jgi:hypothetical protein
MEDDALGGVMVYAMGGVTMGVDAGVGVEGGDTADSNHQREKQDDRQEEDRFTDEGGQVSIKRHHEDHHRSLHEDEACYRRTHVHEDEDPDMPARKRRSRYECTHEDAQEPQ